MCILGRWVANFRDILESLPGIVKSYEVNLLKTKVSHNLRLVAANVIKNMQEIDRTMMITGGDYQQRPSKNAPVTGVYVSSFFNKFIQII